MSHWLWFLFPDLRFFNRLLWLLRNVKFDSFELSCDKVAFFVVLMKGSIRSCIESSNAACEADTVPALRVAFLLFIKPVVRLVLPSGGGDIRNHRFILATSTFDSFAAKWTDDAFHAFSFHRPFLFVIDVDRFLFALFFVLHIALDGR